MKGFVWGFPTSNKFWKNSWFFVGGQWGQSISFDLDGSQMTCRVPRYFCSPQWNHVTSSFTDEELKTLARAAVRPLEKRGKPYLYNEGKMISARLFPQISARRRRCKLCCSFYSAFYFVICLCIILLTRAPFFFLKCMTWTWSAMLWHAG
jgi:hypothetical protein